MHSVSRTAILLFFVCLVFIGLLLSAAVPAIKPSSGFMYLSHHPSPHFIAVIFAYVLPSLIWLDGRQSKNSPLFRFHVVIIPCAIVLFQCAFRSVHCLFGNHPLLCAFHWKRNPVSYYGTNTIRTVPIRFSEKPNHRRIMQTTANRKASKPFVRLDTFLIGALA